MKILLDLQGAQCQSRHRGIGRYSTALSHAFAELTEARHDLRFAFNAQLNEATDALIAGLGQHAAGDRRVMIKPLRGIAAQITDNEARRRIAGKVMGYALERQQADVVWHSSMVEGYVDDAALPSTPLRDCATVATLYDLIPLHDPDTYLDHPRVRAWYDERINALSQCDLLLAISDWVRDDAIERLDISPDRIVTIGAGVDARFQPLNMDPARRAALLRRYAVHKPYVLYNGGFDARKNLAALVQGYARLPPNLRDSHQLVLVGRPSDQQIDAIKSEIRRARLAPAEVVFTGFVPDAELVELYASCALFVFPSLMEGFGLPPLEAMACGAPVIGSNAASLSEVIGAPYALFDPRSPAQIGERIAEVLANPPLAMRLREHGLSQARHFSWPNVAERSLQALERLTSARSVRAPARAMRPCLTCLQAGPNPPGWLKQLEQHYALELQPLEITETGHWRAPERLLYITDGPALPRVREALQRWPGVVLLTDIEDIAAPTPAEHYRLHGYAANMPDVTIADALGLLCLDGVGVLLEGAAAVACALLQDDVPLTVAMLSRDAAADHSHALIESWYSLLPLAHELRFLDELAADAANLLYPDDLAALSDAVVAARPVWGKIQWLVDVTDISRNDIGTGTQRVTRSILQRWLSDAPAGVRIEPIAFIDGRYRYARSYALELLGQNSELPNEWVEVAPQDVFIGLDWAAQSLASREPQLRAWRRYGVQLHFIVYDLLPLSLPHAFHPYARDFFLDWLRRICAIGDSLHCISRATATALTNWLTKTTIDYQFGQPPHITHFFLGAERNAASAPRSALPSTLARAVAIRPSLLMVGTIEPRKAHVQALDAVEQLWGRNVEINLIIVGHHGWMMESLIKRLENHPERERRLFWLGDADDALLRAVYAAASVLLAPSLDEGYGLPLIEAAQQGLPVLARELPVFREVMEDYPDYFQAADATMLAEVIEGWLEKPRRRHEEGTRSWPDWAASATALAGLIAEGSSQPAAP